jgi:hypothetical protein
MSVHATRLWYHFDHQVKHAPLPLQQQQQCCCTLNAAVGGVNIGRSCCRIVHQLTISCGTRTCWEPAAGLVHYFGTMSSHRESATLLVGIHVGHMHA